MSNIRVYVYGFGEVKEFLHTFLDREEARKYCRTHKKLFPDRFDCYLIGDHQSNLWEIA